MPVNFNIEKNAPARRIWTVVGHYGSGKTEVSVSLAMLLAQQTQRVYAQLAVVDLDIINPYFRSRERKELLQEAGVAVYGSAYDTEITAEIPALAASIRKPLEDKDCRVILDVGGNDSGARVLHQFKKYLDPQQQAVAAVVNANRPETRDAAGVLEHLAAIEAETQMPVDYLINNTHLLMETTPDVIARGHALCEEVCALTGKKLWLDCYPAPLVKESELYGVGEALLPIGLYMRPTWLDKL